MAKPISATIYWVDNLYGPDLQDWINRRIDEDADLIAPMRTIHNREFFHGGISPIYDQDGAHELRWTDKGPRILSSQAKPTSFHHDQHGYKGATWISDEPGLAWRIYLHRIFALVLPGRSADRRSRKIMSDDTLFILQKPQSSHQRMAMIHTLKTLGRTAGSLLDYAWGGEINLRDPFGEILTQPILVKGSPDKIPA